MSAVDDCWRLTPQTRHGTNRAFVTAVAPRIAALVAREKKLLDLPAEPIIIRDIRRFRLCRRTEPSGRI